MQDWSGDERWEWINKWQALISGSDMSEEQKKEYGFHPQTLQLLEQQGWLYSDTDWTKGMKMMVPPALAVRR